VAHADRMDDQHGTTRVRDLTWSWHRRTPTTDAPDPARVRTNVVLIHGFQNDPCAWNALLERFDRDDVSCTAVDLPGCGDSEAPPTWQRATIDDLAVDLAELLRVEDLSPAVLVGHSLGCGIAMRVALDQPDLVAGLALFAPISTRGLDFVSADVAAALARPTPEDQRTLLAAAFHRRPDDATFAALERTVLRADPRHIEGAARSMRVFAVEARLGEIVVPTVLIAGDRDRHVPIRNHLATWAAFRRAGLHVEHDVGHVPFVEATEASVRVLSGLVDDVRRRGVVG
jgi:sigma-B regulation protein RsbQ